MDNVKTSNIDDYIAGFPAGTQKILQTVRETIHKAAPEATETISYAIPTFSINGKHLVHFAAFKNHIGFYATPTGHEAFAKELSKYKQGKGSVQFPIDEPMPLSLITKIVKFRLKVVKEKLKKK
ncbi:MAG: iron chaperone [Agriterribacter sp.]